MNIYQLKVVIVLLLFTKVLFSQSIHKEQATYYNSLGNLTEHQYDKLNGYPNNQISQNRSI